MADKKKSFIIYTDRETQVNMLTDEQAGKLFKQLFVYIRSGEAPAFEDGMLSMAFSVFQAQLDANSEKYAEMCRRNAENGAKGGRPKKAKNPENPAGFSKTLTDTDTVTDTETGTGTNTETDTEYSSGDTPEPPVFSPAPENYCHSSEQEFCQLICNYTQNPELQQALFDFVDYRKKGRKQFTLKALELNLQKLDELACYDRDKIAVLHQSVAYGWSGLFPLNQNPHYGRKQPVHDIIREQERAEIQKYLDLLD
ncbi:MAG: hypothetical protein E7496_09100 [Ruminococcus sp.]|nr:hypothetical protein [Ruminococcus sp.]